MKRKLIGGINLSLSAVGIIGSLILSFTGNVPCVFCWIVRISMIAIFLLSVIEILKPYDVFFIATILVSVVAVSAAGYLLYLDFRPQTICVVEEACYSPLFMGIPASVYAFVLSMSIFLCSFYALVMLRNRNEV